MRFRLLPLSLLALLPAASLAQTPPRLYVGAGAAVLTTTPFSSYSSTVVGPAAVVGLQLSPRWAIQTGAQLAWRHNTDSNYYYDGNGGISTYSSEVHSTLLLAPLLARYTFTTPSARLQVDALGGGTWLHSSTHATSSTNFSGIPYNTDYHTTYDAAGLVLGPQVRYRLGAALDLTASLPVLAELGGSGKFSDRLALNAQLGAQYVFGH